MVRRAPPGDARIMSRLGHSHATSWRHDAAPGAKTRRFTPNLHRDCRGGGGCFLAPFMNADMPSTARSQGTSWENDFGVQLSFWQKTPHFHQKGSKRKYRPLLAQHSVWQTPQGRALYKSRADSAPRARKLKGTSKTLAVIILFKLYTKMQCMQHIMYFTCNNHRIVAFNQPVNY